MRKQPQKRLTLRRLSLLAVFAGIAAPAGCAATDPPSLAGTVFDPDAPAKYVLYPGDELQIRYPSDSSLDEAVVIRADGKVSLAFVGDVQAALRSPEELRTELNQRYTDTLKRPDVSVIVAKEAGRRVFLGGEIEAPGALLLHPNETLLQALFDVGGMTPRAERGQVMVMRASPGNGVHVLCADVDRILAGVDRDVRLQPLDVVYVPTSTIARVGDWVDQYINRIIPRPFSVSFLYELHTQPIQISDNPASFPIEITRRR